MIAALLLLILGLVVLVAGAEGLVRGGSRLAAAFGVSPLVVGLTVVAFGTSAPELVISVVAAAEGRTAIALGNVLGSNIANVLLILGAAAVFAPVPVAAAVVRREVPIMIAVTLLFGGLALNGSIGRTEGMLLIAVLVAYVVLAYRMSKREAPAVEEEFAEALSLRPRGGRFARDALLALAGLVLLVVGARLAVTGATALALAAGMSDRVVGLTVVAVGTSLPELATTLVAAARRQMDLAVGNIVGSSIFNLLGILGLAALVHPIAVPQESLRLDFLVALVAALATLPIAWTQRRISRGEGALMLAGYTAYVGHLLMRA